MPEVTSTENRLLWALRGMVAQNCDHKEDPNLDLFNSGYIRAHRTAMEILVEYGHMEKVSEDTEGGRWYEALMVAEGKTPNAFGGRVV